MSEKNEKIQEIIQELLNKMDFKAEVKVRETADESGEGIVCDILTKDDSKFLIGQHGVNLQALQHLARLLIRKTVSDNVKFIIDVNSYRQQKNDGIIDLAHAAAEQALSEKRAVVMKPMTNYERRLVHLELSKNEKIVTESIGEGEGRKVVVKPADTL